MAASFPILLVDDEPQIAEVLQRAARQAFPEARFEYISHPDEVLPYLENHSHSVPRLILLDVDFGSSQTGIDLIAQLRHHPRGHIVPIVMLSGNEDKKTVLASYHQGANVYTHKPYSYNEWKAYVQALRAYWFTQIAPPADREV
jgi:DNA-binding response OmpR family regulator